VSRPVQELLHVALAPAKGGKGFADRRVEALLVAEVARRARVSPWLVRQAPLITEIRKAQASLAGQSTARGAATRRPLRSRWNVISCARKTSGSATRSEKAKIESPSCSGPDRRHDAPSQAIRVQELTTQNTALSQQASEALQGLHQLEQKVTSLSEDLHAAHPVNRALMAQLNRPGSR
jgi:hypothetical protein